MIPILDPTLARSFIARKARRLDEAERTVRPILDDVRRRGDPAVLEYARRFDGFDGTTLRVSTGAPLTPDLERAIGTAAANIRDYALRQLPREHVVEYPDGRRLGQIVRPLDSAGAYIPGGRYPLVSTLLMTVIPAQVAGVPALSVVCPRPGAEVLAVAGWLGVTHLFQAGGAHAIAALAYGTATVPRVNRIVGPGNRYVAAAKKIVAGETGIDFVAGPTEVVIVAAEGDATWIAADMLAQAEHDADASAVLMTTSSALARGVAVELERQLATLPTCEVAKASLQNHGAIVVVDSLDQALELSNAIAPEHLCLYDPDLLGSVTNAGSVFLGPFSPEAAGDYASGPNHVLPTGGAARVRGGLSAADFVKVISVQELQAGTLSALAPTIAVLARAEGLEAHARSVEVRVDA